MTHAAHKTEHPVTLKTVPRTKHKTVPTDFAFSTAYYVERKDNRMTIGVVFQTNGGQWRYAHTRREGKALGSGGYFGNRESALGSLIEADAEANPPVKLAQLRATPAQERVSALNYRAELLASQWLNGNHASVMEAVTEDTNPNYVGALAVAVFRQLDDLDHLKGKQSGYAGNDAISFFKSLAGEA